VAGLLPLVRTATGAGATCLYPVTRKVTFLTDVAMAQNCTEQRSRTRPPLVTLQLPYSRINATDMTSMRNFVASQKGQFDQTWGVVIGLASFGTISLGSPTHLSISAPMFVNPDCVGQQVVVAGAGPAGALFVSTIASFTDSQHVVTTDPASTAVSGADTRWGIYYPHMTLTDRNFQVSERDYQQYDFVINARQTINPYVNTGTAGTNFPRLGNGAPAQFPYAQIDRYQVTLNDNQNVGIRYSWAWIGGGLTGFPSSALRGYELHGPALINPDLALWEAHFVANWGMWSGGTTASGFSYVDPDNSTTYTGFRYDQDVMEISHANFNQNSTVLKIMQSF
jgi:hypothetical protein